MDVAKIREDFPALKQYTWFQNGGVSITPSPVAEAHLGYMREILERGPMHIVYPDEEYPRRKLTKERLGSFFGVGAGDLALMRGVSEGFQTVLRGLDWNEGDEILISGEEEQALYLPALHLRDLFGVVVKKIPLLDSAEEMIDAASTRMTSRTKLVAFSHVITDSGHRLPAREICRVARERGILSFVDLAHAAGLYPIDLNDLQCDFAGILSYKWMYSPYAAGLLFIRKERLDDIRVTYAGARAESWIGWLEDRFELKANAERFEYGPWSWPLVHAWANAVDYLSGIGLEAIWERTAGLATRLKVGLSEVPGVEVFTPRSSELSAAVISFGLDGVPQSEVVGNLRSRWNIIAKSFDTTHGGVRASVPFFLLEEEIDHLVDCIQTISEEH